jgi:hypothetical protein
MRLHNLLYLPHLLVRCTRGNEPLVDLSITCCDFVEYLNILRKKTMDKAAAKEIKKGKINKNRK